MNRYIVKTKKQPVIDEGALKRKKQSVQKFHDLKTGVKITSQKQLICEENIRKVDGVDHDTSELKKTAELIDPYSSYLYKNLDLAFPSVRTDNLQWRKISKDNLDLDYTLLFPRNVANALVQVFEKELDYFTGTLAKVKIFGKWHDIPRKQATYGDPGLTYKYSGIKTPARPWPQPLEAVRELVCKVTGHKYNFVLVNRYKDGSDKMGEHKDDEKDLDAQTPIASVSLGQPRDFYFRHQDARPPKKLNIDKVQLQLQHGSLLLMNPPTNQYWYHALPPRKSAPGIRINLTFRKIIQN